MLTGVFVCHSSVCNKLYAKEQRWLERSAPKWSQFTISEASNQALERLAPPNALCVQHHADDDPARILEGDLQCLAWPGDRKLCRRRGIGVTARGSGRTSEVREKIRLL